MASRNNNIVFNQDNVYIHINVQESKDKEAHIAGRVFLLHKTDGDFVEWKAEEFLTDTQNEEWDIVGPVGYRSERGADSVTVNPKMEARRKYNISFNILDLKSFKCNTSTNGWEYLAFILKDGSTFPALHFHNGGSKALLKVLGDFINIRRSPNDPHLFIVSDDDLEKLSKSFSELALFTDSSGAYVQKFIKHPYTTTMGGFSKVTNYLRDVLLTHENLDRPHLELADILNEEIHGIEISPMDEPGYEMITKTKLPPQPTVKRSEPMTSQQWASFLDAEGRICNVEEVKDIIFRGGVDPSIRGEAWKFLLGFYDWGSTVKHRQDQRKTKVDDYFRMKLQWTTIGAEQERRFTLLKERRGLIDKDVIRTDRDQKFFSGDKNPNLQILYNILMTYCVYNFDLGYVQGMSDILSPILVVMENEVEAFWCFAGAMERIYHNFEMDQSGIKLQLSQIHILMQVYDPELCSYLEGHDCGNFYFCFRWILILFKREFNFHEIQRLWEVLWTDRPCKNFHLIISLAILDSERCTLMENNFGFTEILKRINDINMSISLEKTLCKAEGIFLQLKEYKKLPKVVKDILGLSPVPVSHSPESSGPAAVSSPHEITSINSSNNPQSLSRRRQNEIDEAVNIMT